MVAAYPLADRFPEGLAEDVPATRRDGYTLLGLARDSDPARMCRLLRDRPAGLPGGVQPVVDAGFGWRTAEEALAESRHGARCRFAWLEDPLVPEDAEGCAVIRRENPIGVGDEVTHIATYRALPTHGRSTFRLDVIAIGGVTPARRVQALAAAHAVPVSYHVYPEVSTHLATGHPGAVVETFDPDVPGGTSLDPAHLLCSGGPTLGGGDGRRAGDPGLGFDLDWRAFGL